MCGEKAFECDNICQLDNSTDPIKVANNIYELDNSTDSIKVAEMSSALAKHSAAAAAVGVRAPKTLEESAERAGA